MEDSFKMLYFHFQKFVGHFKTYIHNISWSWKLRVTSPDKQASMHAPRFGIQSKQSSKQPF